jgi:hypothetical protein
MYLKCAHPDCSCDFDSGRGRLFRFQQDPGQAQQPSHWHSVKHFWLCTKCSENYTIGYRKGAGVVLMHRVDGFSGLPGTQIVLQSEASARPAARPRALDTPRKSRTKLAKPHSKRIEILENRSLER